MSGLYGTPVIAPAELKTVILTDSNGNEFTGVVTGEETIFTATDNDVREGMVYASDGGVSTGTKLIPSYHTIEAVRIISVGSELTIPLSISDLYDYTKLQIIICAFNTSISDSVAAEKVVINNNVYNVGETVSISTVSKNDIDKSIELGLTNNGDSMILLRYFAYKEID